MKIGPIAYFSRVALAITLMAMMGFGAASADIHPVDAIDVECESAGLAAQIIDLESHGGQDKPDHDHHAHNCGSCHFHVVGLKLSGIALAVLPAVSLRPDLGVVAPHPEPMGLYRPPRA
ncbi:MAG: hypothetical protein CMF04_05980 [Hyphomonas sp.]|nr:hypothetical protein [Hyphomonas sp.]|tara:strand:+ start:11239 stop:11595 length:357 start_codon:yes stop_codon:yes gene_type:complete